jgi:hypothetical protein
MRKISSSCQALVAYVYNPSYLGGRVQEDHCLRPILAYSSREPISKILNRAKTFSMEPQQLSN